MSFPRLHPLIQPIWVNKTWNEDKKVSNYYMHFRGPSDTKEELDVISLIEGKYFKKNLLSFETNKPVKNSTLTFKILFRII